MATDCVTLWIGDSLGALERACLKSMLRQGHSVALYCYRVPVGVPEGIEILDASAIMPQSTIRLSWAKRSDLYSDLFRYEIQKRALGTWLDLDVYLVAPLDLEKPYLFGQYEPGKVNGAVLRLPPDSPMLLPLLEQFKNGTVPKSLAWPRRLQVLARQAIKGRASGLANTPFGTTGPYALTAFSHRLGLISKALAPEVFYPVEWRNARWILDPAVKLADVITDRTVGVHLWNELFGAIKALPAPKGSFLAQLQKEGWE